MKKCILTLGAALFAARLIAAPVTTADYTAHEWGTFTSVQGADGVQLEWNPLLLTELPKFVYDRNRPLGDKPGAARTPLLAAKTGLVARQRLETPVLYFYSAKEQTVDVAVDFPEGTVTEWYPQQNPLPRSTVRKGEPAAHWQKLRVLSAEQLRVLPSEMKAPIFPRDTAGSHYYAARETDANAVQSVGTGGREETEKFVFYRGVGRFEAPLNAKLEGPSAEDLRVENRGSEPVTDLFVYEVVKDNARVWNVGALNPAATQSIALNSKTVREPLAVARQKLATAMEAALTRAGLYSREAAAMVKTWDDAWFAEPGLRVLYVLPRSWTDRVIPLKLVPAPRAIERVMVGRAELITPAMERSLHTQIERYRTGDSAARTAAIESARSIGLGRFAEPTVRRLALIDPQNREFNNAAWELLWAAFASPAPAAPLTAKTE
jgi:hypothetical protein